MTTIHWPFKDFEGFWAWTGRNSGQIKFFLGIPSIVIAVSLFLFEYHGKGVDERRKTSLDYVQRYVQGDVLNARIKLRQAFLGKDYNEFESKTRYDHFPLTNRDKVAFLDETRLLDQLFIVAEYFEHITICVYSNLCDLMIVCEVLYADMKLFGDDYLFYVEGVRKAEKRPVGRLGEFAVRFANAQECYASSDWKSTFRSILKK